MITDPENSHKFNKINLSTTIPPEYMGERLDQTLATIFPSYSRSNFKQWILQQDCLVDGKSQPPKFKLKGGENIVINTELENRTSNYTPENLPINIIYEDPAILIINKSNNLVVHPGAGNWTGTLLNRLIHYLPNLEFIPRAGIIHRLDQDTTGLMVIAKNLNSYNNLTLQFKQRSVTKIYEAIVNGNVISSGTINAPIGRNKFNRLKMRVTDHGKAAITHYNILKRFKHHTHLKVTIETGRTHQIRVHMKYINFPILGDQLYGSNNKIGKLKENISRQALHAKELIFKHPDHNTPMHFVAALPEDFEKILNILNHE